MPRGHALIVDDSSTARIILARLLERVDVRTSGVSSAEEALTRLQTETFDLIFLDHLLPGMDGFQALERLKSQPATHHIPVFMYTSQRAERYMEEAKAHGAAGVIGKQVDRQQLVQTIDAILSGTPTDSGPPDTVAEALMDDAPSPPPPSSNQASANKRLTGRLATLEIAYEEADEQIRALKNTLAGIQSGHQEALERERRRHRAKWWTTVGLFGVITLVLGWQLGEIASAMDSLNEQLILVERIISGLVELESGQ
ncbi:response regulator receiver domain-containing protein [Tamilnaduibacter salinus]|uniref:Response regulator receiver domain-containing protein n=1 Tax=Tamilnaduibacter salinus TaxID=1484056 RepID=A0A2U1CT97_9GAMM|nr:response regulator [Tamilnaduibacter salinus]PVY69599.1 response regulator receiver domain-containing protein [Tamilnaduibacter salinus]